MTRPNRAIRSNIVRASARFIGSFLRLAYIATSPQSKGTSANRVTGSVNQYTAKTNFTPEPGSMLPGVSIVMPTYQGGPYLPATLAGLTAQDYPGPIALIAVD